MTCKNCSSPLPWVVLGVGAVGLGVGGAFGLLANAKHSEAEEAPVHRDAVQLAEDADDLNTPEALAAVHGLVSRANALLAEGKLTRSGAEAVRVTLGGMDSVFGVLLPREAVDQLSAEEQALFDERQEARRQRKFARADEARARLEAMGIVLEDTRGATRWRRKR